MLRSGNGGFGFWRNPTTGCGFALLAAIAVFGYFYPNHFLIADETVYFDQAMAWSAGARTLQHCPPCPGACTADLPGDYPAGTALLAVPFLWLIGPSGVFWCGLTAWLAGIWGIFRALAAAKKDALWAVYPWFFLPGIILTRTLMSDLPGFALAALFIWGYSNGVRKPICHFGAGAAAGLSLLFRETNLLWALPFLLSASVRKTPERRLLWAGFGVGLLPRLVSGWVLYGHPLYIRDPGISFSISHLPGQLGLYFLVLLVVAPGGLYLLWKSSWRYRVETWATIGLYLAVYGCYGYDALAKSGYKGLILQARYLLPLLPLLSLAAAHSSVGLARLVGWKRASIPVLAGGLFIAVQWLGWRYNNEQQKFTSALYALPAQRHISFSPDESRKYINALYGPGVVFDDTALSLHLLTCDSVWYLHQISRAESADRRMKAQTGLQRVQAAFRDSLPLPLIDQHLLDGAWLRIWKWKNPDYSPPH